jgi:hypothetical protein
MTSRIENIIKRFLLENEFEIDDSQELDELSVGEASEGTVIVDIEEIKDNY